MNRSRLVTWLLGVPVAAACYWVAYLFLFGIAFAIGDAAERPQGMWAVLTEILDMAVTVLGFPFMFVPSSPAGLELSHRVFGSDTGAVYGLSALNSLLWGAVLIALVQYIRRRQQVAA